MRKVMTGFTDQNLRSVQDVIAAFVQNQSRSGRELLKAIIKVGNADEVTEKVKSVKGLDRAAAAATMANHALRRLAVQRTQAGLIGMAAGGVAHEFELRSITPEDISVSERDRFNLPVVRKAVSRIAKFHCQHGVGMLTPVLRSEGISVGATVLGRKPTHAKLTRRRQGPQQAVDTQAVATLRNDPLSMTIAAAELWATSTPDRESLGGDGGPLSKGAWRKLLIDRFALEALMTPGRSLFAFGDFRRLGRSVLEELTARANGLDLGGIAPIQPQGIAPFLATLISDKAGTALCLPAVKNR
jgi:hypothetical protein